MELIGGGVARLLGIAALAVVSLSLASCGAGTDEEQIRAVMDDAGQALEDRDPDGLCDVTTSDAQRHVGYAGHPPTEACPRAMHAFIGMMRKHAVPRGLERPVVKRIVVEGDRATAVVAVSGGGLTRVPLAKHDGNWKLDALYGGAPGGAQKDKF